MRHKFLGIGEAGYHPLKKIHTVFSGLRYAVLYDFSVTYKLVLSVLVEARHNEKIKVIKDIAAAAVGIAIFTWFVVLTVELGRLL